MKRALLAATFLAIVACGPNEKKATFRLKANRKRRQKNLQISNRKSQRSQTRINFSRSPKTKNIASLFFSKMKAD